MTFELLKRTLRYPGYHDPSTDTFHQKSAHHSSHFVPFYEFIHGTTLVSKQSESLSVNCKHSENIETHFAKPGING